ncbi:Microtubule-associated tumor suppressor 1 [Varanus komodoensis]|nr:Microtubule-associated tumor suppressor 1 [Varanus komodoensis]
MNVESFEEKDLQPPLIIQDENGNKCVRNAIASAPLNGSTVGCNQQCVGPEDYTKCKAASEIQTTSSDLHCTESPGLQNVAHDYICMGTSHVEARKAPSPAEQPYMYALNQTFPEPEGLLKESFAIKRTQNCSIEGTVPYCQADRYPVPLAVNINTGIQDESGCSQMEQEDASSSDSFITVVNLGETVGSKCYEVGCVLSSSRETCKSVACAQNAFSSKPDTYSSQNAPGIMYLDRGVLPNAPSPTGNSTTNYMDLVSQKNEQQKKQGLQGAEWDDCCCRGSPELEPFNVFKEEKKKYMHSTPEHDKKEWPSELAMDDTISGLSHLPVHSFSEHSELEFHKDGENLANVQNICKGDQALLKEHDKASKMVENDIPKLERAAAPEPNCQETFVIFNPTADEHCLTSAPTTGSKNATFAVLTMPEEVAGGISKLGKNGSSIKEQPRRNSLKTNSEKIAIKSTNRSPFGATITKARKAEIVSFPKPNFKNIKPKVISRPASQPKENATLKAAQRSPQLSTASSSSPSSSPRQISLRKKTDLDKGTKTEAPMNKTYKQNFNKHLPSQAVQAATHSENTSHKFPKTTASKQNVEQPGKARCPSSACSPVVVTCSLNSAGTPNASMENAGSWVQPCVLNSCQIPQEEEQQNDFLQVPGERSAQGAGNEAFPLAHTPLDSIDFRSSMCIQPDGDLQCKVLHSALPVLTTHGKCVLLPDAPATNCS